MQYCIWIQTSTVLSSSTAYIQPRSVSFQWTNCALSLFAKQYGHTPEPQKATAIRCHLQIDCSAFRLLRQLRCVQCVNCGTRLSWLTSRETSCHCLRNGYAAWCSGGAMCLCLRPPSTIIRRLTACSDRDSSWFSSEPSSEWENSTLKHNTTASFKLRTIVFPHHYVSSSTKISSLNDLRLRATDHANPQVRQCVSTEIVPPTQLLYLSVLTRILRTHLESADLSVPCLKPNFEFFSMG